MTDPKDAERLAAELGNALADINAALGPAVKKPIDRAIARLREERDTATQRVETLEAEIGRLRFALREAAVVLEDFEADDEDRADVLTRCNAALLLLPPNR